MKSSKLNPPLLGDFMFLGDFIPLSDFNLDTFIGD
jgi:hypothetical protein